MNAKQAKAARQLSLTWVGGEQVVDRIKYRQLKKLLRVTGLKLKTKGFKKRRGL